MIPIYTKTADFEEPKASLYYLVAADGIYLVRRTALFSAIVEAPRVAGLAEETPSVRLFLPKLPRRLMEAIHGFFRAVHNRWEGEAIVLLYYSPETRRFRVGIPPQSLRRNGSCGGWHTSLRTEYGWHKRPEGFLKLGDAHSHGRLSAFFSDTDDRDDKEDGLRIVIGRLHKPRPDVAVSFIAGGTRFEFRPEAVMEKFSTPKDPPPSWLRMVSCQYNGGPSKTEGRLT